MPPLPLKPISAAELLARQRRVSEIGGRFGFVGRFEYRHLRSQTGGAQFGLANAPGEDVLLVYAEAFERDADPEDFLWKPLSPTNADINCWPGIGP